MPFTLFARLVGAISAGEDTNPETSPHYTLGDGISRQNVIYYRAQTVTLALAGTHVVVFPYSPLTWNLVIAKVVGEVRLDTVGVNFVAGAIAGETAGYGTAAHPGVIGLTTKAATSFTFTALAADTTVTYLAAILAADDEL